MNNGAMETVEYIDISANTCFLLSGGDLPISEF